jgi:parallel beta-helix repeat protein
MLQSSYKISSYGIIAIPSAKACYTIYNDGLYIICFNNITKVIELQGQDAKSVIQYAIDSAATKGGGTVKIKDGEYSLSGEIKIYGGYHNIILEGESWNTILKTNNGAYNAIRFLDGLNVNITIRNLKIDGGYTDEEEWPQWDEKNGIMGTDTWNCVFENLFITNTGRTGIYNTQGSNGNIIRNNYLYRCRRYGISYTSSNRGTVVNNTVKECGTGIVWDSTYGNNWYTIFANNTLINNKFADLYALGDETARSRYGIYINNLINSSADHCIWTNYIQDVIFLQNKIYWHGEGIANLIQIGNARNVIVSHNELYGSSYESIAVWGENNIVIDHNLISPSDVRVYWGNNTYIKNNYFTGAGVIIENDSHNAVIASNIGLISIDNRGVNTCIYNNTNYNGQQLSYYVTINPASSLINEGDTQTLTATIIGGVPPYIIRWFTDNVLQPKTGISLNVNLSMGTHIILIQATDAEENEICDTAILYVRWG